MKKVKIGDELTIAYEIITIGGQILFEKDQKVIIREVWKTEGHWSNLGSYWIDTKINGIKLKDDSGIMSLNAFKETKDE